MTLTWLAVATILVLFLLLWLILLPGGPKDEPWSYPDLHPWDAHRH